MTRLFASALLASLLALSACGYHALNGENILGLGPGVHSIELKSFENETREPGLEQLIGEAINEEFARRGWLKPRLEGQDGKPDLVLTGILHSAAYHSASYSAGALAVEEGIEVGLDVSVHRGDTGELVYQHPDLRLRELFLSSADPNVFISNKEQALRRISAEIAERIHDELYQKF
jgi:lipopolysaccharide assembly LptE-like protein